MKILKISNINALKVKKLVKNLISLKGDHKNKCNHIIENYNDNTWGLLKEFGDAKGNFFFLYLLLIIIACVMGPLNVFVFAKAGKRHKLFITTPLISLAASALLLGYIIISDGFGGKGHRIQHIELLTDKQENKQYVTQEQICQTGVLLGSSFTPSSTAVISPVPLPESCYTRVASPIKYDSTFNHYTIEPTSKGLKYKGDWFQSRSRHGFYLQSIIPTRGKISLLPSTQSPKVNSSLSYPIETLYYLDNQGEWWSCSNLETGKTAQLKSITAKQAQAQIKETVQLFSSGTSKKVHKLSERKNHFIAITTKAPAIDTLDTIHWEKSFSIITGPLTNSTSPTSPTTP